jgi:hypothetical protein
MALRLYRSLNFILVLSHELTTKHNQMLEFSAVEVDTVSLCLFQAGLACSASCAQPDPLQVESHTALIQSAQIRWFRLAKGI